MLTNVPILLQIGVLHGGEKTGAEGNIEEQWARQRKSRVGGASDEEQRLMGDTSPEAVQDAGNISEDEDNNCNAPTKKDWKKQIRLLIYSFLISGGYVSLYYHLNATRSLTLSI